MSLYSTNQIVFIMDKDYTVCEVGIKFIHLIQKKVLKGLGSYLKPFLLHCMTCNAWYKNLELHTSHYLLTSTLYSCYVTFKFVPLTDFFKNLAESCKTES